MMMQSMNMYNQGCSSSWHVVVESASSDLQSRCKENPKDASHNLSPEHCARMPANTHNQLIHSESLGQDQGMH